MLVEFLVLFGFGLAGRLAPECRATIGNLRLFVTLAGVFDVDWERDIVGMLLDDAFQLPGRGKFVGIFFQLDQDAGAAFRLFTGRNGELAVTCRFPRPCAIFRAIESEVTVTSSATVKTE